MRCAPCASLCTCRWGTCQQLYLALRIALLVTADNVGRAVPIIADDILVNFDSQRRAGAAKALAQLARHRQVILLTCHEEIVETMRVADRALPKWFCSTL